MPVNDPLTIEQALDTYHVLVERFEQAVPMLTVGLAHGPHSFNLSEVASHPTDALSVVVEAVQRGEVERPTWALFSTEAYMKTFPDTAEVRGMRRGQLARSAQAGDKSVDDVVICHLVTRGDGMRWTVMQPFERRAAIGAVQWYPWSRMDGDGNKVLKGDVPRLLAQLVGVGRNYG